MLHPIEGPPASLGPAVGRLHYPGAAARHDREAYLAEAASDFARDRVVRVIFFEAGRAEDGDAGADKVENPKPFEKLPHNARQGPELPLARLRPFKKDALFFALLRLLDLCRADGVGFARHTRIIQEKLARANLTCILMAARPLC